MTTYKNKKALAIVAHPDDEILGIGGTLAKLRREGCETHVLILTNYADYRKDLPNHETFKEDTVNKAMISLGVTSWDQGDFPSLYMDSTPIRDIAGFIEECLMRIQPNIVFTHFEGDLNKDHQITSEATLIATRPVSNYPVKEVYAFETPSSSEWSFGNTRGCFTPDTFVSLESKDWDTKLVTLAIYWAELRLPPHPRSAKAIEALAVTRGATIGVEKAEALMTLRRLI